MLPATLPFNLALGLVEVLALVLFARRRQPVVAILLLLAWPCLALLVSGHFRESAFGQMRLLAWAGFIHAPLLLFVFAGLLRREPAGPGSAAAPRLGLGLALLGAGLLAIGTDAFLLEPQDLQCRRVILTSPRLHRTHRIALITDLQTDAFSSYEQEAILAVLRERPDLVLFGGDYLQVTPHARDVIGRQVPRYEAAAASLAAWLRTASPTAPLGVFAVAGNVDPEPLWMGCFAGTGVVATSTTVSQQLAPDLWLTRLSIGDSFDTRRRHPRPGTGFHVILGHAPEYALAGQDADLLLAGHTHGGQVRLPGVGPLWLASAIPPAWDAAPSRVPGPAGGSTEGPTLVISRGVGLERGFAPPLRFNCRPEVVILELRPTAAAGDAPPAPALAGTEG